ncbi:MAG: DUF6063 family protein [Clostridiales bacterium]|nr:DUF6063 family protein [Clostridiales bacterium]
MRETVVQTAKILSKLLAEGEINAADSNLLSDYRNPEVRADLDIWGEELGFALVEMRGKVYLVPHTDSGLLSFSIRDIRESEAKGDRMIEAFLQCYISMAILWALYGGKNNNPKRVVFLQTKDILALLDERFTEISTPQAQMLETGYEINFSQIACYWNSLQAQDEQKRKTKMGAIHRACRLMERQKLLRMVDEGREIRPTERLDDLMIGYYLDMRRLEEIHQLFESQEGTINAKIKQD